MQDPKLDEAKLEACARYIKSGKARGTNLVLAYNARSVVFGQLGQFDRALEEVDEAIRLAQSIVRPRDLVQLVMNRGSIYWKKADFDRALTELDEAVRLNPKLTEAYYWRGLAYLGKKDYDRAIADFTTAIKGNPKDAEFYLRRCEAYSWKREFDNALADCNEGLRRDPKKLPWGYTWRGAIYENTGEVDKAKADYEHALSLDPALAANARERLAALSQAAAAPGDDAAPATAPATPPETPASPAATLTAPVQPSPSVAAGGGDAPSASTQAGSRQVLEKFGMLGTWSVNCEKGTAPGDTYSIYRALDDLRVQRDVMSKNGLRPGTIESAVEAGSNEVVVTWVWDWNEAVRLRIDGKRWRNMEISENGTKSVADGVFTAASDQAGKATSWANQCQAAPPASGEGTPGSARQILESYGVLGIWSVDCSSPASPTNAYVVFRALDDRLVQYDIMTDPKERAGALIVETAQGLGPNEVSFTRTTQNRDVYKLRIEGNRARPVDFSRNGTQYVANGLHLPQVNEAAVAGKETQWVYKCQ